MFSKTQILGVATATSAELVAGAATLAKSADFTATLASTKVASVANAVQVVPKFTAIANAVSAAQMANFAAKFAKMARVARKFTAKFTAFAAVILVAFALTACDSGPNLEVSLVSDTTNLQKEAGFGGLVDWGQAGQISVDRQIVKITSLEEEGVDIFKVVFNQGNCGDGYDSYALDKAGAEKATREFYAQLPKIDEIFLVADEQYFENNKEVLENLTIESEIESLLRGINRQVESSHTKVDKKQAKDIEAIITSKKDEMVKYVIQHKNELTSEAKAVEMVTPFVKKIGDEILNLFNTKYKAERDKVISEAKASYGADEASKYTNEAVAYDIAKIDSSIKSLALNDRSYEYSFNNLKKFRIEYLETRYNQPFNKHREKGVQFKEVDGKQHTEDLNKFITDIVALITPLDNLNTANAISLPKAYQVVSLPEPPPYTYKNKIHLDYGENKDFTMYAKKCKIKKVEIETDKGNATYTF